MDKVRGGTPRGFSSICKSCRNAQVVRGLNLQEFVHCGALNRGVRFPVETCSMYDDMRGPSLSRMREIAWEVTSRNRGAVGFGDAVLEITIQPPQPQFNYPMPPAQPTTAVREADALAEKEGMK